MRQKKPLVSIVLPVRNGERFLEEALESICAQTWKRWELVVVDDASTDETSQILRTYGRRYQRIRVIHNRSSLGVAGCLNRALRYAKGQYVARMDADDVALPKRLEKQVALLEARPELVAVGTQVGVMTEDGELVGVKRFPTEATACYRMLMVTVPMQHPTLMVRSKVIKKLKYDATFPTAEDWELYFRLLQFGDLSNTKERLYLYRQEYGSNGFHNLKKAFKFILKARVRGIVKYGYKPDMVGVLATLVQVVLVGLLPERWVFRLFSWWRISQSIEARARMRLSMYPAQLR